VIAARDSALTGDLREHGLRVPEWRALAALHARGRLSMSELANLSSIDRTTLSRTVDRMQEAGWLTRLADDADLRVTRLTLTDAGAQLFARIWPTVDGLNRAAAEGLPDGAVEMVNWTLAKMRENLERGRAAAENAA
jgi:DNA-binding MarR family transcriptional regulator